MCGTQLIVSEALGGPQTNKRARTSVRAFCLLSRLLEISEVSDTRFKANALNNLEESQSYNNSVH